MTGAASPSEATAKGGDNGTAAASSSGEARWLHFQPYVSVKTAVLFVGAMLAIWIFSLLYLGGTWDPLANLDRLHVAVLNCDEGASAAVVSSLPPGLRPLGQRLQASPLADSLLQAGIWNASSPASSVLSWTNHTCWFAGPSSSPPCGTPEQEAACLAQAQDDVRNNEWWGLIYFPSSTSRNFLSWYTGAANPAGPIPQAGVPVQLQHTYGRGNSYTGVSFVNAVVQNVVSAMSTGLAATVAQSPQLYAAVMPTFFTQPLKLVQLDVVPVYFFGQNIATYIFCILLWLGSAFLAGASFSAKLPAEIIAINTPDVKDRPQGLKQRLLGDICVKTAVALLWLFCLSVLLHCTIFALGKGEANWYRNPGESIAFAWWLSWSFISVNAVLLHTMGPDKFNSASAFLLILQLMTSGGIYTEDLTNNRFFYLGKGLPFYWGARGFRCLFFGSEPDTMWLNWVVLLAFNVVLGGAGMWLVLRLAWTSSSERLRPKYVNSGDAVGVPVMVAGAV